MSKNDGINEPLPVPALLAKLTRRAFVRNLAVLAGGAGLAGTAFPLPRARAQSAGTNAPRPSLYLVATAHNDTQWNWTVQHTIAHCIPDTMRPNWALMQKYPAYTFNYEGVIHYMWFKEYHPEDWPTLQSWVKQGRWKLSGSWINAVDVIVPSPESLFRQALYGQQFFRREFGQQSHDIYLPDCFGFPYSLPAIGHHSGLQSFSTQKFDLWGGWFPTPFSVGRWAGVDGSELVAALRPGPYNNSIRVNPATSPEWNGNMQNAGGKLVNLRYYGTGDQGGTPDEASVARVQQAVDDKNAPVRVINTGADQLARDLTPAQTAALPRYQGELTMRTHGVGGYTSQAAHKKWNRMNEQMADAAERIALAGAWLGGPAYPQQTLSAAWVRTLANQFHDTLPGTCVPQAYTFTWNDDLLGLNQLSQIMTLGVGAVAQMLDTRASGVPLVVYNPLDQPRTDAVEASVTLPHAARAVRVYDRQTGAEAPSQILGRDGLSVRIVFIAHAPSVGCRVYDVRPAAAPCALQTGLRATAQGLESRRYTVGVGADGDITHVYDKDAKQELLASPAQLEHFHDRSPAWPAWEILWETVHNAPLGVVSDNARVRVTEHGPARVALEVTRTLGESTFVQHIRLTAGGDWVEVHNDVDWQTPGALVKAAFPITASNPHATFDLGLGTIERPNAEPNRYEVNAQQWADITDTGGGHGMAVLTEYKYGWDKPADNILRLSLIRTPDGRGSGYPWQNTNDIGLHHFRYALAGHAGDWRVGQIPQRAARFNQPLRAFQTAKHTGAGGHEFSLLRVSTPQVGVRALKRAEDTNEWVVRLHELHGQAAHAAVVSFAAPITAIREINAAEENVGSYAAQDGALVVDLGAYQPRSFAVTLGAAPAPIAAPVSVPVALPANFGGVSSSANLAQAAFDSAGGSYPAELWPASVNHGGVEFQLAAANQDAKTMLACQGQTVALPPGNFTRLSLLAASADGDHAGVFTVHTSDGAAHNTTLTVQDWQALIGQWYSRVLHNNPADPATFGPGSGYPDRNWDGGLVLANMAVKTVHAGRVVDVAQMTPGFVRRDPVAWVGTHRHAPGGDLPYCFCYLYQYALDLPAGATHITLPSSPHIRIAAMTAAHNPAGDTQAAGVLYEPDAFPRLAPRTPAPVVRPLPPGSVAFRLPAAQVLDGRRRGLVQYDVPHLPTRGGDSWTINQFIYLDKQPEELTLVGGFGDGSDTTGSQRYLIKFHDGIHFWASNVDVPTGVAFDLNRWQMVTLTFDGRAVRIYKDAHLLQSAPVTLTNADDTVKIGSGGPWNGNRLAGQVAGFTIWNSALASADITALLAQAPH